MRRYPTLAAACVAAAACVIAPAALAASSPHTLASNFESWFQPDPTCDLLGTCLASTELPVSPPADLPSSQYPEETLHVAWTGTAETARSYVAFDVFSVLGEFETAVLDVPLDVDPANGSTLPETSSVVACITTDVLENSSGSFAPPPEVDCTDGVLLSYVDEPTPHLTGDLGPLIDDLRRATGIALLPDAEASGADSWHVVFSSHRRAEGSEGPPTLKVTVAESEDDAPAVTPTEPEPPEPVQEATARSTPRNPGPVDSGARPIVLDEQEAEEPVVAAPPAVSDPVPEPVAIPVVFDDAGRSYPQLYLLPLALLLVVPYVGRSLTGSLRTDE